VAVTTYDTQGHESWYSQALVVRKESQSITFNPLADKVFGDPPFTVTATVNSGLPITYTAMGGCTVVTTTVTLTGAGTCTVTAHQSGNDQYDAAPDAAQAFSVAKVNQTITFDPLADKKSSDAPFTLTASASSALTVTFTAAGPCTVQSNIVTLTGAGTCTITARQAGNANYNAAPDVPRSFAIVQSYRVYLSFLKR
jgi:hypothetical protein